MIKKFPCPFSVGDIVRFTPSQRTISYYPDPSIFGIKIGEELPIKSIKDDIYLEFENKKDGWAWNDFTLVRRKDDVAP